MTSLRPDMVLVSEEMNIAILEVTVPWEEHMEKAVEWKVQWLISNCYRQGWRVRCFPVEAECRCFAGQPLCRACTALGIPGERRRAIHNSSVAAGKASMQEWIRNILNRIPQCSAVTLSTQHLLDWLKLGFLKFEFKLFF